MTDRPDDRNDNDRNDNDRVDDDRVDDDLGRRIRATMAAARADAPAPPPFDRPANAAPASGARWLAVAATVVLLAGAVVALAVRHGDDHPTTAPATTVPNGSEVATSANETTTDATSTPALECPTPHATYYDIVGTMHTLVADTRDITVDIQLASDVVCTEGQIGTKVTFTNHGSTSEHLQYPTLILNGGMAKWVLFEFQPFDLQPGESHAESAGATLPAVQPRDYALTVLDSGQYFRSNEVHLTVVGPDLPSWPPPTTLSPLAPLLCATTDLTATSEHVSVGTLGERTDVLLTNTSGRACSLFSVQGVTGLAADGTVEPVELQPDETLGNPPELVDAVLQPGASKITRFHWTTSCEPAVASRPITVLRLTLLDQTGSIDVPVDPFDVACTVGIA